MAVLLSLDACIKLTCQLIGLVPNSINDGISESLSMAAFVASYRTFNKAPNLGHHCLPSCFHPAAAEPRQTTTQCHFHTAAAPSSQLAVQHSPADQTPYPHNVIAAAITTSPRAQPRQTHLQTPFTAMASPAAQACTLRGVFDPLGVRPHTVAPLGVRKSRGDGSARPRGDGAATPPFRGDAPLGVLCAVHVINDNQALLPDNIALAP